MGMMRNMARKVVFPTLMAARADKLLRIGSAPGLLNLTYHGVVEQDSTYFSPRHIHRAQFERHLRYLKKNFAIIRQAEAFEQIREGIPFAQPTIAISFDDGFANNLHSALPLLEKYEVPVTFCVASVLLEPMPIRCLWSELVAAMLYFFPGQDIHFGGQAYRNGVSKTTGASLSDTIKALPCAERDMALEAMLTTYDLPSKMAELPEELWRLMTAEELAELAASEWVDIGSHAHLHYNLGQIPLDDVRRELTMSKSLLEGALQKPVTTLAYPDGSYTPEVKELATEAGYTNQLAVHYRYPEDQADPRILNRHSLSSTTTFESNMLLLSRVFAKKSTAV